MTIPRQWSSEASHYLWNQIPTDKWSLRLSGATEETRAPQGSLSLWGEGRGHFCLPTPERTQSQGKAVRFIVVRPLKLSSWLTKCGDTRGSHQLIAVEISRGGLWRIHCPHLQNRVWWAEAVGQGQSGLCEDQELSNSNTQSGPEWLIPKAF